MTERAFRLQVGNMRPIADDAAAWFAAKADEYFQQYK